MICAFLVFRILANISQSELMMIYLCVMSKDGMGLIPEIQGLVNDVYFNDYVG